MDTRLKLVNDTWDAMNETERNTIYHRTVLALALKNSRRQWIDITQSPIMDRRRVHILGSPRRRMTDLVTG